MKKEKSFFGKQFKKIMSEKNFTQQELADKIGIARPMLSNWINGFRNPSLNSIKKVAKALDVSYNYFIENSGYNDINTKVSDDKDIKILKMEKHILKLEKEILELKLKLKEKEQSKKK